MEGDVSTGRASDNGNGTNVSAVSQVDFCSLFQAGDTVAVYSSPYVNNGGSLASSETAYTNLGTATISTVTQLNTDPNFHPGLPYFGDTGASIYPLVRSAGCQCCHQVLVASRTIYAPCSFRS